MSDIKLKICGMKHPENIREVAELHPDYMGFIFYEKTPRFFDSEIPEIPDGIKKTGVFVNAGVAFILEKIKDHQLEAVQLHGDESAVFCGELKTLFKGTDIEIIKVFSVKDDFDFKKLEPYERIVDFFLFDTKGKNKGGNGISFNWELLKDYPSATPFFLSGGIGLEETPEIEELAGYFQQQGKENLIYAVDVNSRFESQPGLKEAEKLKKFKSNMRLF
ncbi:phosphoribosylanthranilate isomerase [Salegentibacter chungangensis]|uniref:N-(5'-phosphoribosyl)anthranilate isomerase n=1 Tax=Salegentibacter chungangensis TaxID=1335724 RepID=A0ABW3NVW1_9FLAO